MYCLDTVIINLIIVRLCSRLPAASLLIYRRRQLLRAGLKSRLEQLFET